mmetsp:Transcript_6480/g.10491  ORF Transcript_6480/g.10491 Transcript_6480/m.10491 type:complete len:276 (-) Transcript_6480:654-1481(-)
MGAAAAAAARGAGRAPGGGGEGLPDGGGGAPAARAAPAALAAGAGGAHPPPRPAQAPGQRGSPLSELIVERVIFELFLVVGADRARLVLLVATKSFLNVVHAGVHISLGDIRDEGRRQLKTFHFLGIQALEVRVLQGVRQGPQPRALVQPQQRLAERPRLLFDGGAEGEHAQLPGGLLMVRRCLVLRPLPVLDLFVGVGAGALEELVEDHPHAEPVRGRPVPVALPVDLRGHVAPCAADFSTVLDVLQPGRNAHVRELYVPVGTQQDVVRLDVPV